MDGRQRVRKLTVKKVFLYCQGIRKGLIKALTTDFERFYEKCDPDKDNLCLYGHPDGSWEVKVPAALVPPEHPEPTLGINFAKDGMRISDWRSLVAMHSDAWLMSFAFYHAYGRFDKNDRNRLFQMINRLPSVFEVVTRKQAEQLSFNQSNGNKTKSSGKMPERVKMSPPPKEDGDSVEEDEEEAEEAYEQETSYCGACGDDDDVDAFWIWCDVCEKWFHGQCVKITPAMAEHIKHYKCPGCSNKKARVH